jgi:hypothetical protein
MSLSQQDAGPVNLSLHNYTTFSNLLAWPLVPLVGLVAAFNLVFLLNIALSGFGAWLLARDLTGRSVESWMAAAAFACSPVLVARSAGHFSLVSAAPLPVFAFLMRRLAATGQLRYAMGLGAVVAWATFSDAYYGVFCVFMGVLALILQLVYVERRADAPIHRVQGLKPAVDLLLVTVAGFVLALLIRGGGPVAIFGLRLSMRTMYTPMLILSLLVAVRIALALRPRVVWRTGGWSLQTLRGVAAASIVMAALLSPVLYAFGERLWSGNGHLPPTLWRSSPPGVDLLAFVLPNPTHAWWGGAVRTLLERWSARPDAYPEVVGSISLVMLAVIGAAAWTGGWRPSRLRVGWTIFFALLALGPFVHVAGFNTQFPTPWAILRYVPVLGMVRSPGRFSVLVTLGACMLFLLALVHLGRRFPERRSLILAGVGLLLAVELVPAPRTLYSASIPAIYRRIAEDPRPDVRVLELPTGLRDGASSLGNFNARTQYFQTAHGKAIVGGYLSRVSARRKAVNRRMPVLNALLSFSEGRIPLAAEEQAARDAADAFLTRARLGYVIIDHTSASPALVAFATEVLGLTELEREGPMVLYEPRTPSPPAHSGQ